MFERYRRHRSRALHSSVPLLVNRNRILPSILPHPDMMYSNRIREPIDLNVNRALHCTIPPSAILYLNENVPMYPDVLWDPMSLNEINESSFSNRDTSTTYLNRNREQLYLNGHRGSMCTNQDRVSIYSNENTSHQAIMYSNEDRVSMYSNQNSDPMCSSENGAILPPLAGMYSNENRAPMYLNHNRQLMCSNRCRRSTPVIQRPPSGSQNAPDSWTILVYIFAILFQVVFMGFKMIGQAFQPLGRHLAEAHLSSHRPIEIYVRGRNRCGRPCRYEH